MQATEDYDRFKEGKGEKNTHKRKIFWHILRFIFKYKSLKFAVMITEVICNRMDVFIFQ